MFTAEQIIRHEAGHAIVAHRLGRPVNAMVWRARKNGSGAQGDVDLGRLDDDPNRLTILAAGFVADYLNCRRSRIDAEEEPLTPTFQDMMDWERGLFASMDVSRAIADNDLREIRRIRTGGAGGGGDASIADASPADVQRAIDILNEHWDLLSDLVEYARSRQPGLGPRELRRFFAGERFDSWARLRDKPRVLFMRLERRKLRSMGR